VYAKFVGFNSYSPVFDFSNGAQSDNVRLANPGATATIGWSVRQGLYNKYVSTSSFDSSTWTHVVVTVSDTTMKTYKNGALVGTQTDGWEPNVLTRTQHWLGRSAWSTDGYFDGTIAKLKIWHNKELSQSEIEALPKMPCLLGTFGSGYPNCQVCPAGSYSLTTGSSSCTTCPIGTYLSDDGVTASEHDHLEDCKVCEAGKYNPDVATHPTQHVSCSICPDGTYNADAATDASNHVSCTNCPAGKKNDKPEATDHNSADDCDLCSPGTFTSSPGSATCNTCEAGLSSGSGATECAECPAGYVCTSDGRQEPCPSGQFSSGSSAACQDCEKGHKCPGATNKIPCDAGTFQSSESQANCNVCEAGTYQPDQGQESCDPCPAGYFCPRSSSSTLPCGSSALYCPELSSSVTPVTSGFYTLPDMDESKNFRSSELICEIGHACAGGFKRLCNGEGEYSDETGSSACKIAPAGKKPRDDHQDVENCSAGTYSIGGLSVCDTCEVGKFSDDGAVGTRL
jgi:hypothetical protein